MCTLPLLGPYPERPYVLRYQDACCEDDPQSPSFEQAAGLGVNRRVLGLRNRVRSRRRYPSRGFAKPYMNSASDPCHRATA
jgi:hypothetical protein